MTFSTYYNAGTVSVSGSNVTGVGTGWSGNIRSGDVIWIEGTSCRIDTVNSNTSLTLARPWPGAAVPAGSYYEIWIVLDAVGYQQRVKELLEDLNNGNLSALAGLTGAVGKVPMFTGAGTMDLVDAPVEDGNGNLSALAGLVGAAGLVPTFTGAGAMEGREYVLATMPQSLTPAEKGQARANIGAELLSGFRNKIINGNFTVNQRGAASKAQSVGVYGYDRWKGHANGLQQIVEALPAGTYTLTWVGGGVGTFGGVTSSSPFVADTAGGNVSVVVPSSATRVSLVPGDASAEADPFSPRHPQQELALCQRYYQRYGGAAYFSFGFGFAQNQNSLRTNFIFPTTMRVAPSFSYGGTIAVYAGTATEISTTNWQQVTPRGGVIVWSLPTNVLTPGDGGEGRAQNDSTAYIAFDSEL